MSRRKKLVQRHAKRLFSKTAGVGQVRRLNMQPVPMRGGFRI